MALVPVLGRRLEVERLPARRPGVPPLVLLHEGLGSVAMWRDFPTLLAARTGAEIVAYSRLGYGASDRRSEPYGPEYMHEEALVTLPALLAAAAIERPILFGHSDGASIALLYGARFDPTAIVAVAPHLFVEEVSIASIEQARIAYRDGDLRARLARYHDDVDSAFHGWNDAWLAPEFRDWNIEDYLPGISCPVLAIQGEADEYGTLAQVRTIGLLLPDAARVVELARCGHSPQRDQPEALMREAGRFIDDIAPASHGLAHSAG